MVRNSTNCKKGLLVPREKSSLVETLCKNFSVKIRAKRTFRSEKTISAVRERRVVLIVRWRFEHRDDCYFGTILFV